MSAASAYLSLDRMREQYLWPDRDMWQYFLKPWTGCSLEQLSLFGFEEIRRNSILILQSCTASVNSAREKQSGPALLCATCVRSDNREDAGILTLKSITAGTSCTQLRGLIIEKWTDNTVDGI